LTTVFGLFDYFDCSHLVEKSKEFERDLSKLKEINQKLYKFADRNQPMIEYRMSLLNMGIDFQDANRHFINNMRRLLDSFDFNNNPFKDVAEANTVGNQILVLFMLKYKFFLVLNKRID
jgi:hypothetical protein